MSKKKLGTTLVVVGIIVAAIPVLPGFIFWIPGAVILYRERKKEKEEQ